jgi:hypothetical protein
MAQEAWFVHRVGKCHCAGEQDPETDLRDGNGRLSDKAKATNVIVLREKNLFGIKLL